jgi:hypothetical protein
MSFRDRRGELEGNGEQAATPAIARETIWL